MIQDVFVSVKYFLSLYDESTRGAMEPCVFSKIQSPVLRSQKLLAMSCSTRLDF